MAKTAKHFSYIKLDDSTGPDSSTLNPFYNFSSIILWKNMMVETGLGFYLRGHILLSTLK